MAKKKEAEPKAEKKKRYEVSAAKTGDPVCYTLFFATDSLSEAKNRCIDQSCDEDRECIVFDNESLDYPIIFRHGQKEVKDDGKPATPKPAVRKKAK